MKHFINLISSFPTVPREERQSSAEGVCLVSPSKTGGRTGFWACPAPDLLLLLNSVIPPFSSCSWESITLWQCAFCATAELQLQSSLCFLAHPLLVRENSEISLFPLISALPAPLPLMECLPHFTWSLSSAPSPWPFFQLDGNASFLY